jgi:uncharacterized coiled-coil protein SlyX
LVLSVALTPVEFRCGHYCPQCQWEEESGEVKQLRHRVGEQRATIERQSAALESQSDAMDRQSAEVRRLQLREQQLLARLASRKRRLRLFGGLSDGP